MADNSLSDLNYGRPGLVTYNLNNRELSFSRHATARRLKQVSDWQLTSPPVLDYPPDGVVTASATTSRKEVKRLTHDHPQLAPATKHLPELNAVSKAVTFASSAYDPLVGDLLSFGNVFIKQHKTPRCIAALPAGPSGNILRLMVLGQQKQGWGDDKSVWLSGPTFGNADSGYWNEDAVPIQQVCFGHAEGVNSVLAVRFPLRTVLFRPLFHRGRQAAGPSTHYDLPPSVVSPRPLLNITLEQTGGVPHADVAFNPDYQFQLGIVDQQSNWAVWQLERRAKRDEYTVSRLVEGSISLDEDAGVEGGDGWAKIMWAGDSSTILVCNRRQLSLIEFRGEVFKTLPVPTLIPQRSTDWILDVRRHPQHQNWIFVLTSTRLFLVAVTTSNAAVDSMAGPAGATVIFSRRHYRGDEDITLQLSVQTLADDGTCLFLTSRLNKLVQTYHLQNDRSSELVSSSDPVALELELPHAAHVKHIYLHLLEYGTQPQPRYNAFNASAHSYLGNAVPFHQLLVVSADLSVHQTVLTSATLASEPEPLAWTKVMRSRSLYPSNITVDGLDDFVVPNGLEWTAEPILKLKAQKLRILPRSDRPEKSADYVSIYENLISRDQAIKDGTAVEVITDQLRRMMELGTDTASGHPVEVLDNAIDVVDIDEASVMVNELFVPRDNESPLQQIAPARILHIPESEDRSVASLYDTILQNWIAPLPVEIPISVRQAKERLARRIATEVTLASAELRKQDHEPGSYSGLASGVSVSLPVLPSKPADTFPSTLPTPPQSSVPPSSPLFPESLQPSTNDPLSRLRRYLTIDDDQSKTATVVPPTVIELLSHWKAGTNPSTYDWEATESAIRPESIDELSQELREKERKKKERREKRQKREDELMRAKAESSQTVFQQPSFPRSSPGPTFGGMAASSQAPAFMSSQVPRPSQSQGIGFGGFGGMPGMMPQSQVEPGRFGGRPDKKKKKGKSRVSGF